MTAVAIALAFLWAATLLCWLVESVGKDDTIRDLKAENARLRADIPTAVGHPSVRRLRVVEREGGL